ncbi:hypothetical protein J6590_037907 [Homalodisca vitripennis]|nr:hypothetical protein J6590_037907 [Homalodisca vitripennis]
MEVGGLSEESFRVYSKSAQFIVGIRDAHPKEETTSDEKTVSLCLSEANQKPELAREERRRYQIHERMARGAI